MGTIRFGSKRKNFIDRVRRNSYKLSQKKIHSSDEECDILRKLEKERTRDRVRELLKGIIITPEYIAKKVCEYYNLDTEYLNLKTRKDPILQARQISHFFSKEMTKFSNKKIGLKIGNKDHATVIHSWKQINNYIETEKEFREEIEDLRYVIKNNL